MTIAEAVLQMETSVKKVDLDAFKANIRREYNSRDVSYIFSVMDDRDLWVAAETNGLDVDDCLILARAKRMLLTAKKKKAREKYGRVAVRQDKLAEYNDAQANWFAEEKRVCAMHFDHEPTPVEVSDETVKDFVRNNNSLRFKYWAAKKHPEWVYLKGMA